MLVGFLSACTIACFGEALVSNSKRSRKCVSLNNLQCQARSTLVDIYCLKSVCIWSFSDLHFSAFGQQKYE